MGAFNQIKSDVDNCVYFFDTELKIWRKVCDVGIKENLPPDVRNKLKRQVEEAKALIMAVSECLN